jgi:hypothetical protein
MSVPVSQLSAVQRMPSVQGSGVPATQAPDPALQVSTPLQKTPSSQTLGVPWHVPPPQTSGIVQLFSSLHGPVLLAWVHAPLVVLQPSSVQTLPSSQFTGEVPTHAPPAQVSTCVQAFPSVQGPVLLVWTHPVAVLQLSSVQTSSSSQSSGTVPAHVPALQTSEVVQALSSSQGLALSTCWHPAVAEQLSSVHALPSLQFWGAVPTHAPALQVSTVVHTSLSVQLDPFGLFGVEQTPVEGLQTPTLWH